VRLKGILPNWLPKAQLYFYFATVAGRHAAGHGFSPDNDGLTYVDKFGSAN
jgi:hypothetical protein